MSLLHIAGGATEDKLDASDVFSTYLYTNGSTQTINNGIDLAGKGGLVWIKSRSVAANNTLIDTERGVNSKLVSNTTSASATANSAFTSFNSNGFSLAPNDITILDATYTYASWTFRKAPKFFTQEVKVHTNGTASTVDLSTLGEVGMVTVKATSTTSDWYTWHRGLTAGNNLKLNLKDAQSPTNAYLSVSGTTLTINSTAPSATYIVYAWAHDPSADGIIQCGSFTTDASGNATVNLGWEPQYLITKSSTTAGTNWSVNDSMRTMPVGGDIPTLFPNLSDEEVLSSGRIAPNAVGFMTSGGFVPSSTYIYMAIRRPNKVPTSGTEVFQPIVYTGTNADNRLVNTIIAPDMVMVRERNDTTPLGMAVASRLTGNTRLQTSSSASGITDANSFMTPTVYYGNSFSAMNGFGVGNDATCKVNADTKANNHIALAFKRAKGFFDMVCYAGTGVQMTVNHNLGVVPELMIIKKKNLTGSWTVYQGGADKYLLLDKSTEQITGLGTSLFNSTNPTASVFSVGTDAGANMSSAIYVTYLFATLPGVSKVGSYTGNGTSQTIPCGFSTGARFVLSKAVSTTGNWNIGDSTRGITSGTDPLLCLNTTDAEVTTDDWLDPESSGFIVNETASAHANTNGVTYIYLAIS